MFRTSLILLAALGFIFGTTVTVNADTVLKARHGGHVVVIDDNATAELVTAKSADGITYTMFLEDRALKPITSGDVILMVEGPDRKAEEIVLKLSEDQAWHGTSRIIEGPITVRQTYKVSGRKPAISTIKLESF